MSTPTCGRSTTVMRFRAPNARELDEISPKRKPETAVELLPEDDEALTLLPGIGALKLPSAPP
eukprot:1215499-Rhodomonas_salina.1